MLRVDINLLFTVINLLILAVALRIFLFKPVHKILEQRQAEANAARDEAQAAIEKADALKAQCAEELDRIEAEKKQILLDAHTKADGEYDEIIADARATAEHIIENAKKEAERGKTEALESAREEIEQLVSEAARKIVEASESSEDSLFDDFLIKAGMYDD